MHKVNTSRSECGMFCVHCEVLDNPITNAHAQHSSTRYAAIKALLVVGLIHCLKCKFKEEVRLNTHPL